jgi:hypothetical protein
MAPKVTSQATQSEGLGYSAEGKIAPRVRCRLHFGTNDYITYDIDSIKLNNAFEYSHVSKLAIS